MGFSRDLASISFMQVQEHEDNSNPIYKQGYFIYILASLFFFLHTVVRGLLNVQTGWSHTGHALLWLSGIVTSLRVNGPRDKRDSQLPGIPAPSTNALRSRVLAFRTYVALPTTPCLSPLKMRERANWTRPLGMPW